MPLKYGQEEKTHDNQSTYLSVEGGNIEYYMARFALLSILQKRRKS